MTSDLDPIDETIRLYKEIVEFHKSIGSPVRYSTPADTKSCSEMWGNLLAYTTDNFSSLLSTSDQVAQARQKARDIQVLSDEDIKSAVPGTIPVLVLANLAGTIKIPLRPTYLPDRTAWTKFVHCYADKLPKMTD